MRGPPIDRLAGAAGKATDDDRANHQRGEPTLCGDIDMRIGRDGTWFYHGSPITRKPLVRLFSKVLRRDENGDYWLVTPIEKARIQVDDAPFIAVSVFVEGTGRDQRLSFRTNLDDEVVAGPEHPVRVGSYRGEPAPYLLVRDRLEALIARSVYYELVEQGEERELDGRRVLGIWSAGIFFALGEIPQ